MVDAIVGKCEFLYHNNNRGTFEPFAIRFMFHLRVGILEFRSLSFAGEISLRAHPTDRRS